MNAKETAYHEAGHAVIGYRLRLAGGSLSIIPKKDSGTLGHAMQEQVRGTPREWMFKAQVITLYAGFASERKFNPKIDPYSSWQDNEVAAAILKSRLRNYSEDVLRDEAAKMVEDNWVHICAVAKELERSKEIADPWEYEIIVDAIDNGEDWEVELFKHRARTKDLRKPK